MKKLIAIITVVIVLAGLYIVCMNPFMYRVAGDYNTLTKRIRCFDERTCWHEVGHKVDHLNGWVSKSDEWIDAVEAYRNLRGGVRIQTGIREMIMQAPRLDAWRVFSQRGGQIELYANILMYSEGDPAMMPEVFVEFYDWERAGELMDKLWYNK